MSRPDAAPAIKNQPAPVAGSVPTMLGGLAPECPDLDADGTPDVVLISGEKLDTLITVNGRSGRRMMTATIHVTPSAHASGLGPQLADLDGDGELEAIVGSNEPGGSAVQAVCPRTGRQRWRVTMGANAWPSCHVGDVNGDRHPDVVAVNRLSETWAVDGLTGSVLWKKSGVKNVAGASVADLSTRRSRCRAACSRASTPPRSRSRSSAPRRAPPRGSRSSTARPAGSTARCRSR